MAKEEESNRYVPGYLGKMWALAMEEWKVLLLATIFLLIASGMGLVYPKIIGWYVEEVVKKKRVLQINNLALAMGGIVLVQGVAVMLRAYLFTMTGEKIVANLRTKLFSKIISQDIAFFDERRTGELINRLSADTTTIQNTASVNISMLLRFAVSTVGALILLFITSVKLTLLMLVIVPPVALGAVYFGRKIRKIAQQTQDALADANHIAEETLSGIRTVRSFTREDQEKGRYKVSVDASFELAKKRAWLGALFVGTVSFAAYVAIAIVLWYGGKLVISEQISVGNLTSFILYTLTIAFSLGALGGLWADFMRASGAASRVFDLIDREPSIPTKGGATIEDLQGHIQFEQVDFAYPTRKDIPVLQKLDLEMKPGEIVALVGPSGSGKSTIGSLLSRLYDPENGRILLDSEDIRDLDPEWLRSVVGVVSQEPILFSTSIEENILYGRPEATKEEVIEAARKANAHDFIEKFPKGYETEVGERGIQLSGGQKQRVAIARAILKNPQILLLDEATSALDTESEALVKDALDKLMKGRTTLIIAHRLSTVKDANRVMVLDQQEIVESGTHDELMALAGLYKRLVEKQLSVH